MEKNNGSKVVSMQPTVNTEDNKDSEGSLIEELQKWDKDKLIQQVLQMNRQLYNQDNYVRRLRNQINEMQDLLSNKILEYRFRVIECASKSDKYVFDSDFVLECINEITESLSIPKQKETEETPKDK